MKIKVLGGFGSELPGCNLTGFLINGRIVLDAGTISSSLDVSDLRKISHVVLSHAHLDHISGDDLGGRRAQAAPGGPVVNLGS